MCEGEGVRGVCEGGRSTGGGSEGVCEGVCEGGGVPGEGVRVCVRGGGEEYRGRE